MSIRVELAEVDVAVARQSDVAYLLTVSDDGRVHVMAVMPAVRDGVVVCAAGNRSRANAVARPAVTVMWPPMQSDGLTLLVDGTATVDGDDVLVHPTTAILHATRDPSIDHP